MKNTLDAFFNSHPALAPKQGFYIILHFNGKSDLQKNIPNKIKSYNNGYDDIRFMILHDKDSADCIQLKSDLVKLVEDNNIHNRKYFVRIVCSELESWFSGNIENIRKLYGIANDKLSFKDVDVISDAKGELKKYGYSVSDSKIKKLGQYLDPKTNKSTSFKFFISGLKILLTQ